MNERALLAIVSALETYEAEPLSLTRPRCEFDDTVYSKWVIGEILDLVWDHPWTLASETIKTFATKLETYAATAVQECQKRIFAVAAETAWEMFEDIQLLESR